MNVQVYYRGVQIGNGHMVINGGLLPFDPNQFNGQPMPDSRYGSGQRLLATSSARTSAKAGCTMSAIIVLAAITIMEIEDFSSASALVTVGSLPLATTTATCKPCHRHFLSSKKALLIAPFLSVDNLVQQRRIVYGSQMPSLWKSRPIHSGKQISPPFAVNAVLCSI